MSDPLELELQAVVSHMAWVLGTEPGSSRKSSQSFLTTEPFLQPQMRSMFYLILFLAGVCLFEVFSLGCFFCL